MLCGKPSRLPDLPAAQAPSLMEQLTGDDRNMVGLGWRFVATTGRSTPVTTHTDALGLNSFENRGSSLSLSNTNTLAFTFTHFFSESWATELGGGIPPVLTLRGHGSIGLPLYRIFPGVKGRLPLIDLANPDSNPLATTRAWLASVVFKYYLGERDDRFRPFAGLGVSPAGVERRRRPAAVGPHNVSAKVKRVWEPAFMLDASYQVTRRF
ncbi:OmpW/AlkL family protein [Burkholderia ubonensis]|uniref:OmpW/AlkL family protein n=1 Tax=Burkholderia ubonensis TaxID=101571 RepID=UPI000A800BD0|nr:OmpW family outer membrane protein [Burkholderia ubonensis]